MIRSLSDVPGPVVLHDAESRAVRESCATAELLVYLAEIDARQLYLEAAYPSMFAYCVDKLHLSEDSVLKRLQAARTAREFPVLFEALADGRLNLTAIGLLAPHLTSGNVEALVAAASRQSKSAIKLLLAQRFPQTEAMTLVETLPAPCREHAPAHVEQPTGQPAPGQVEPPRSKVAPLAPQRFTLLATIDQETYDLLTYAQGLLGHQLPSGERRRGATPGAQGAGGPAREAEVRGHDAAPPAPASSEHEPPVHPGARDARRPPARRWPVHVRERGRAPVPSTRPARVRSHRSSGARGRGDGCEHAPTVSCAQPVHGQVKRALTYFMRPSQIRVPQDCRERRSAVSDRSS